MIFMEESICPRNKDEAFRLQEQTRDLHAQMELVDHALDVLLSAYFRRSVEYMQMNGTERALFAASYSGMRRQIETICTLFEECLAYVALLRGENTPHNQYTEETVHCGEKIRDMYAE